MNIDTGFYILNDTMNNTIHIFYVEIINCDKTYPEYFSIKPINIAASSKIGWAELKLESIKKTFELENHYYVKKEKVFTSIFDVENYINKIKSDILIKLDIEENKSSTLESIEFVKMKKKEINKFKIEAVELSI